MKVLGVNFFLKHSVHLKFGERASLSLRLVRGVRVKSLALPMPVIEVCIGMGHGIQSSH